MTRRKELHEGVSGRGDTTYLVVTVRRDGMWLHVETFATKAEALSWIKYA